MTGDSTGNMIFENDFFLRFFDIRTGSNSLLCVSDNTECCTEDNANWFLPGSTTPLNTTSSPYSVSRSTDDPRNVALMRLSGVPGDIGDDPNEDDGLYCCEIIGIDGSTRRLYVWLDSNAEGKIV